MLSPATLGLLAVGVVLGMVVGVMPGLGPSAGIAILLPLTLDMDATGAVVMLAAIYYGAMYGGTITSVLVNTPGESAAVASTFDGYPLAKAGRAGPALVLAAVASFVAGILGVVLVAVTAPVAAGLAASFGPPELLLVVIAGLLTIIAVMGGNRMLGALSALIGFAIATVGVDLDTGAQRYTFGSPELIDGIDFIPVAIGLFGVGEILWSVWRGEHRGPRASFSVRAVLGDLWPSVAEWLEVKWTMLRGSVLGFVVGLVPGAGATVASLAAYSVEKSVSKDPRRFGKGAMPGLVGPEAANNGASAGAMVPLLTLGVPGSASTAVLLAGFLAWGLQPGPRLLEEHPEFAWGLIASMFLGNMMLLVVNVAAIPIFASIAKVPLRLLAPAIVVVCALGAFTVHGSIIEVGIMLACGVLGFYLKRFGMSPAALVIALVLGPLAEKSLRQTLIISHGSFDIFLQRGASQVLLCFVAVLLVLPVVIGRIRAWQARRAEPAHRP
ncbi:MAG: tripartite tricarboxylate transporter permease [Streptosporangiales bacterium]|nr:tripartite tricarboxylate transporter permease [Streptosporangiales bacterium]